MPALWVWVFLGKKSERMSISTSHVNGGRQPYLLTLFIVTEIISVEFRVFKRMGFWE